MTQRTAPWWFSAALCLPYLALSWNYRFLCDDAFISFRYARNLANGFGIRFNISDAPLEGFSNFLWVLIAAIFEATLADPTVWMPVLSAASGAFFLVYLHRTLLRHFPFSADVSALVALLVGCNPAFAVWSTSGLETMPAALALFAVFERLVLARDYKLGAVAGIALCTLRVEGIAWFAILCLVGAAASLRDEALTDRREILRPIAIGGALVIAFFAAFSAFRLVYFGDIVPNPVHVKVALGLERFSRGGQYLALFWLTFVPQVFLFAGAGGAIRWRTGKGLAIVFLAAAFPIWAVSVGGDFMPMGRLLVGGLVFLALLGGFLLHGLDNLAEHRWKLEPVARRAVVFGLGGVILFANLLPGFDAHMVPNSVREPLHFRHSDREFMTEWGRWENMVLNTRQFAVRGKALRSVVPRDATVVSRAIGALGYYSELYIYDQYGLVSSEVALREVSPDALDQSPGHDKMVPPIFFIRYEPDILYSRYVFGSGAAKQMYDSMKRWVVPNAVRDVYVPDFVEVDVGDDRGRGFLFMVRRVEEGEDGRQTWTEFEPRRLELKKALESTQRRRKAKAKAKAAKAAKKRAAEAGAEEPALEQTTAPDSDKEAPEDPVEEE